MKQLTEQQLEKINGGDQVGRGGSATPAYRPCTCNEPQPAWRNDYGVYICKECGGKQ